MCMFRSMKDFLISYKEKNIRESETLSLLLYNFPIFNFPIINHKNNYKTKYSAKFKSERKV